MTYPELSLNKGSERGLLNGHPWIFSGAVATPPARTQPGAVVDVVDCHRRFIGRGHYNPNSDIRVRLLTRTKTQPINQDFYCERIARAHQLRLDGDLPNRTNAYRIVHGENDGLPGLVVDFYNGFLSIQFHTWGMEAARKEILAALAQVLPSKGLFERSDVGTRRAEGLPDRPTGVLQGEAPPATIQIEECGVPLHIDLYRGQKTGFFLDQRDNRALLQHYARDQSLLNCFAYTSGFSAHALRGGARRTLDVDISSHIVPAARQNLTANASPNATSHYLIANIFPFLEHLSERGPLFDIVVLDPPSLLRRRGNFKQAMGIYTKLNRNALRLVRSGGLLVTASCSSRISAEDFFLIHQRAATGAQVESRILHSNLHASDHPANPAFPEGRYLKCIFARVLR